MPGQKSKNNSNNSSAVCNMAEAKSASGSRSDRATGNNMARGIDDDTSDNSLRTTKYRPLLRLDRLLRRWLPGYNYLRGGGAANGVGISVGGAGQQTKTDVLRPPLAGMAQQRNGQQTSFHVDPSLPARKRKDGEVLLDAGIAKSEFCLKLEQLLRAKLIDKD